ncbi:glycosyl-4,4'-diaponeurosporenoate acyltransferase [Bacillus sp. KH172YL63]|uniref:glycosyl-4,4'-diaponeurosporenoate acyltransferase CrtO family protein n=1 Tax=Bacillus sp. KH172YL63 TaxID=2709784 RepID=UPI00156528EE|nr:glycosyl-4,4'-diaponeurosporenoate acyltransferase [Bacillus sp. KH172YL63]
MNLTFNIVAWITIHLGVSYLTSRIHRQHLASLTSIFLHGRWEVEEGFYRFVHIKKWKAYIPDAGGLFQSVGRKDEICLFSHRGRNEFLCEINRAELSHWLQMLPAPLFFIFNTGTLSWCMLLYGILFNLPIIFIQRFNRLRILKLMDTHESAEATIHSESHHVSK